MSQYYQTYYSTGEFAKLCHTTKETLFHYDEIGLLKPQIIKENGYRYYLSSQYFEFDFIKVLQEAKMSLKEIKEFMIQRNNENFVSILNEKYLQLEEEKKKIEKMQYRIQQSISMTKYGVETQHMVPFLEECPQEHLLTIALPDRTLSDREMMRYISEHFDYCAKHNINEELPLGTIIYRDQFLKRDYHENMYYVKIQQPMDDKQYYLKPQGTYATLLHEGFYDTIDDSFQQLFDFIDQKGYQIIGNAYEYEIHNYFTAQDMNHYLISLSVQVEKR
ncbi:MerR family transcriptional regulator [Candidatus Stoquefichus massiliensis]|uniref:MerR family transcriptional regulator n=1 Tax=Candidatus Stoquefichus massiliensis TaxID=1470350 RepID=UPI000488679B|nr:MerR family transcriptional regulator [Candidatus Stoquefichus massiliensis]